MEDKFYYHMFANGADSQNFILSLSDYYAAFNLIGVCAANSPTKVVSFAIEDTHPHLLIYGTPDDCITFSEMYRCSIIHHIVESRGTSDSVRLDFDLAKVDSEDYLRNVAIYTIIQPTKDGKKCMPYNYPWGTCPLYFKSDGTIPIWQTWPDGKYNGTITVGSMSERSRHALLFSKRPVPKDWLFSNGFLLPSNYVDIHRFESIFETPNCFRVFLGNSKKKDEMVVAKMAKAAGVTVEDLDAYNICVEECRSRYGKNSARWLTADQRIALAHRIKRIHHLANRQIARFCRVPIMELKKYQI